MHPIYEDRFLLIEKGLEAPTGRYHPGITEGIDNIHRLLSTIPREGSCNENGSEWYKVRRSHTPQTPKELSLQQGEFVTVTSKPSEIWWSGYNCNGKGYFSSRCLVVHSSESSSNRQNTRSQMPRQHYENSGIFQVYYRWAATVNSCGEGQLTRFPYLPEEARKCHLESCRADKEEADGLKACRHDVEAFLRKSEKYSSSWLKRQRLFWHPDRFGQLCTPEHRAGLCKISERMFVIVNGLAAEAEVVEASRR